MLWTYFGNGHQEHLVTSHIGCRYSAIRIRMLTLNSEDKATQCSPVRTGLSTVEASLGERILWHTQKASYIRGDFRVGLGLYRLMRREPSRQ